jgi:PIN domain nuclease of toxin-antitoxin system
MRYLLDTQAFIWLDSDPDKLSPKVSALARDPQNVLFLSLASVWEMQIKLQLGKLTLPVPLIAMMRDQRKTNQIKLLHITLQHILALESLPYYHKDPFDRLIVAQSRLTDIPLITTDATLAQYPITTLW